MSHLPISTSTEVVLDTNVCVDLLNSATAAGARLGHAAQPLVPLIVFGELFHGAFHSARVKENLQRIENLTRAVKVVIPDWETALVFGKVRTALIQKGKTIPDDDMWIAAIALRLDRQLVTRDKHFDEVDGLQIIRW